MFLFVLAVLIVCGAIYESNKRNKVAITVAPKHELAWVDHGPTLEILGKTFVKDGVEYVYKGLFIAQTVGNPNPIYGVVPDIPLNKKEFLDMLIKVDAQ